MGVEYEDKAQTRRGQEVENWTREIKNDDSLSTNGTRRVEKNASEGIRQVHVRSDQDVLVMRLLVL